MAHINDVLSFMHTAGLNPGLKALTLAGWCWSPG